MRSAFLARLSLLMATGLTLSFGASRATAADTIQFPKEELATESVVPVFDNPTAVKNRAVVTAKHLEIGVQVGYALTEPFFNPLSFGLIGTYHINESSGINLLGSYNLQGTSSYAKELNPIPLENGGSSGINANLQNAPAPKYLLLASYEYTGFYGKISLTKESVMNLSIYGLLGIGAIGIGDSTNVAGNIGIGQKLYFNPSFALRVDLRELLYEGPDVLSTKLDQTSTTQPSGSFTQKLQYGTLISVGVIYLLPL
jgi:outer membrane beta-barrel protein